MNSIIQKTIDKYGDKIDDFICNHEIICSLILLPVWGYMIVSIDDTFSPVCISDEENPLSWAGRWFMLIVLGTLVEMLVLLMAGLVLTVILFVLTYGYLYVLPLVILFGALYFGRKLYLNSNSKETKDND